MDRFRDKPMGLNPSKASSSQNNNINSPHSNEVNVNVDIKQEITDIDFEDEKIEDTASFDDGYHSKCGEIYINNINKEFSLYCSLCNANFMNFNLFSHHILYGNHGRQLFFLNDYSNKNNENNRQLSQLYSSRQSHRSNIFPRHRYDMHNTTAPPILTNATSPQFTGYLNIENARSIADFRQPMDFDSDSMNEIRKHYAERLKCKRCFRKFQSYQHLKSHSKMCFKDKNIVPNPTHQTPPKNKTHSLDNIVSVATFSLAVCSTPNEEIETGRVKRLRSSSYDNLEIGKTRSATAESTHHKASPIQDNIISSMSAVSASLRSSGAQYASKSTSSSSEVKSAIVYPSSNKYTGSAITHGASKANSSVIRASATIAEISSVKDDDVENSDMKPSSNSNISLMREQLPGSCPYCPVKFQKMKYLNFHLQKYHPERVPEQDMRFDESANSCYRCEICNMIFRRPDFYKKHMRKHPKNAYKPVVDYMSTILKTEKVKNEEEINRNEDSNDVLLKETIEKSEYPNNMPNSDTCILPSGEHKLNSTSPIIDVKKPINKLKRRLKCQYCGKTCLKLNHLLLHERKHKMNSSVKCRHCEQRFYFKKAFEYHLQQAHPENLYELSEEEIKHLSWQEGMQIPVCPDEQNSNKSISLKTETEAESSLKSKNCKFCPKIFKTVEYRILHEKVHAGVRSFLCKYCEEKFDSVGSVWSHQKICFKKVDDIQEVALHKTDMKLEPPAKLEEISTQEKEKEVEQKIKDESENITEKEKEEDIDRSSAEPMEKDIEKTPTKSRFKCTYCKKLFSSKSNWVDHVRKHTGEKFECNICDYKTTSPFSLKSHMLKLHDYSKATTKTVQQEKSIGTETSLNTIETATKTSLLKSKLLLQSLAKFDSLTLQEKNEKYLRLKLFKCKFCHDVYTKKTNLENHLKTHLKSKQISFFDIYKCKICPLRYKTDYQLLLHERKHYKEKLFECNLCDRKFGSKVVLSFHRKMRHNVETKITPRSVTKCQICEKVFLNLKYLRSHIEKEHDNLNENNVVCKICTKSYSSNDLLNLHLKEHCNDEEQKQNNECDESMKNVKSIKDKKTKLDVFVSTNEGTLGETNKHKEITTLSDQMQNLPNASAGNYTKREKCKVCGIVFDYHCLATHMQTHRINNKFHKCDLCESAFRFKSNLVKHKLLVHKTNKRNTGFKNKDLNQSNSSDEMFNASLVTSTPSTKPKKITIRTLIKEKKIPNINGPPYQCPHEACNKSFGRRTGFNKHYLLHLDTFKCKYCNRCFQTTKVLQKHINFHIENLPYKCKVCLKAFAVKHALIWHKRWNNCGNPTAEESNISYNCESCSKSFISKSSLSQHLLEKSCMDLVEKVEASDVLNKSTQNEDSEKNEIKIQCETCNKNFLSLAYLTMHYKKTDCKPKSAVSKILDTTVIDSSPDCRTQNANAKNTCKICSRYFEHKLMLSWHTRRRACEVPSNYLMEYKIEEKVLKIESSENSSSLLEKTVTDNQVEGEAEIKKEQYQCEVCFKIFVVKGFLLRHMKYYHPPSIENLEQKIVCKTESNDHGDENIVENEENLNRRSTRKRVENEDTKYQCQICLKKFETKGLLAGHTRTKACFKSSSCMSTLRAQKSPPKEANEAMLKCNQCDKYFANEGFLINHTRSQVCLLKKNDALQEVEQNNLGSIEPNTDENNSTTLLKNEEVSDANNTVKTETPKVSHENKVIAVAAVADSPFEANSPKIFTCKRCNKQFPAKVGLAWHTRRKECLYQRQKFKQKTTLSVNQQATKIRKKLIDGIVSSRKFSAERKLLRQNITKAAIQVYKHNKSVAEMAEKYRISKTIIYRKINAFKAMNMPTEYFKDLDDLKLEDVQEVKNANDEKALNMDFTEDGSDEGVLYEDSNKLKVKIDLGVLRNEKDKNMVKAIRNYIRDRKKGRKLPQRFYCDRYQIRKIHFYRKLFKLGLVRKKGPQKRDATQSPLVNAEDLMTNIESEIEKSVDGTNNFNKSKLNIDVSDSQGCQTPNKSRRGRKTKCSEEVVRRAVLDYRMGRGTQLQLCEKYNIGIWAFHRVNKILQKEMPNLKLSGEENDDDIVNENPIVADQSTKNPAIEDMSEDVIKRSAILDQEVKNPERISTLGFQQSVNADLVVPKTKLHKGRRKIKMMKTCDLKKRRSAMMEACGELIENRKSKYNIAGTKENAMLMDAISDVVSGTRAFSNAVKHYKISFYTLQRYLKKYNDRMKNNKCSTIQLKEDQKTCEPTEVNQGSNTIDAKIEESEKNIEDVDPSNSIVSTQAAFSSNANEEANSSTTESDTESELDQIVKNKLQCGTESVKINSNQSFECENDATKVFDSSTGQSEIKRKSDGRGCRGKMRQTVYSKPGTKENKILMEAISEIKNKGKSVCFVSRKYQISMQTVTKYIKLFEKQGVISKIGNSKAKRKHHIKSKVRFSKDLESISNNTENEGNQDLENIKKVEAEKLQIESSEKKYQSFEPKKLKLNESNKSIMSDAEDEDDISLASLEKTMKVANASKEIKDDQLKQNVLKENAISLTKEKDTIKDSIRKPTYISQKLSSLQLQENEKSKTTSIEQIRNTNEVLQKETKLIKSTIEIRKPTYITQKPSATIVKQLDIKQAPLLRVSPTEENTSNVPDSSASEKNITLNSFQQDMQKSSEPKISTCLDPNLKFSEGEFVKETFVSNEQDISPKPSVIVKNTQQKSVILSNSKLNENKNIDTDQTESQLNTNIKIRKPTYITQKAVLPQFSTIKNPCEESSFTRPIEKFFDDKLTPSTSATFEMQLNTSNIDRSEVPVSSSLTTLHRKDVKKTTLELRDQTIKEFLNARPIEIDMHPEINEDDLIIEDAMRSLLEQDVELDLGNVVDASLTVINDKTVDLMQSMDGSNSACDSQCRNNNSSSSSSGLISHIGLQESTNTLATAYKILNECDDPSVINIDPFDTT